MREFVSLPFRSSNRPRWYGPLGYVVAALGVAAATAILWIAQPVISLGSVYLVYLVVVVTVAVGWGLGQGVLASVLGFLAANFFFIEPRYSLTVASFQDVLALVIFLALAILTSQLVARLRREAEEARRGHEAAVQAEILRRTDALRVALLSAVAHDLRTPLATIKIGATNLLSPRIVWSNEDRRDILEAISSQVDHINHLVSNLLDVSRIEEGHLRLNKEPHRLSDVIETVLERLQPTLSDHPVDTNVDPGIPPVPMDVVEIDEVLTNLLANAVKYTPPGTPIHASAHAVPAAPGSSNEFVEVLVADEGPGIPRESLPYLFQRFYRVTAGKASGAEGTGSSGGPGSSVGTGGWGLGLAIVKGIVEAHGGQVRAWNQPGGGAVFAFTLPIDTTVGSKSEFVPAAAN
jgi:two-component system sensor histidine kinase KdpD